MAAAGVGGRKAAEKATAAAVACRRNWRREGGEGGAPDMRGGATRGGEEGVVAWAGAAHTLSAGATKGEVAEAKRDVSCVGPPRPVRHDAPLGAIKAAIMEREGVEGESVACNSIGHARRRPPKMTAASTTSEADPHLRLLIKYNPTNDFLMRIHSSREPVGHTYVVARSWPGCHKLLKLEGN